jgi:hypothetical protein
MSEKRRTTPSPAIAAALFRITHEPEDDITAYEAERALPDEQAERSLA